MPAVLREKLPREWTQELCVSRARVCVCFSCLISSMAEDLRCSTGSEAVYTADITVRLCANKLHQQVCLFVVFGGGVFLFFV